MMGKYYNLFGHNVKPKPRGFLDRATLPPIYFSLPPIIIKLIFKKL